MIRLSDLVEAIDLERTDRLPYAGGAGVEVDR